MHFSFFDYKYSFSEIKNKIFFQKVFTKRFFRDII